MTREAFDTEWDRLCGLYPAGRRSKAAYFVELRHLTDPEIRTACKAFVQSHTSRMFPSVGEVLMHVQRRPKEFAPQYPIVGASKDELKRAYERLEGFYELAQYDADKVGTPAPDQPATHAKFTLYRVLQKLIAINAESIKLEYHDPRARRGNSTSPQPRGEDFSDRGNS